MPLSHFTFCISWAVLMLWTSLEPVFGTKREMVLGSFAHDPRPSRLVLLGIQPQQRQNLHDTLVDVVLDFFRAGFDGVAAVLDGLGLRENLAKARHPSRDAV